MLTLTTASSNATSQVPFWLQILSIAVAPIVGFIGVAIGAFIAERNRRSAYIIEEKKKAYLEFIDMLARINSFWSSEFTVVMRHPAAVKRIEGFSKTMIEALHRTFVQIRLLGSQHVVDAAGESFTYVLRASTAGLTMLAGDFDGKKWNEITVAGIKVMAGFSDAARKIWVCQNLRKEQNRQLTCMKPNLINLYRMHCVR